MTSKTKTMLCIGALLSGSLAGFGCHKTQDEARRDDVEAQQQADEKIEEANAKAGEKVAEANREAADQKAEARRTAAEAQATANEKIRDNNRAAIDDKDGARSWGQKQIDSVDSMIDDASVKAQSAGPKAKANFKEAMTGVKQQRDALNSQLATLDRP